MNRSKCHPGSSQESCRLRRFRYGTCEHAQSCDICGATKPAVKRLCIDHDHSTGRCRGTLCVKCNVLVGFYEKLQDGMLLEKVKKYVNTIR